MPYLLFLKKRQNLKLSFAANYRLMNLRVNEFVNTTKNLMHMHEYLHTFLWASHRAFNLLGLIMRSMSILQLSNSILNHPLKPVLGGMRIVVLSISSHEQA